MYFIIKTLHVISSTILFGTGIGIAFFTLMSYFSSGLAEKYFALKTTVLADYIFTAPAVIIQPATGFWLILQGGYDPTAPWLVWTYALYLLAGICWLPVVHVQIELKRILASSLKTSSPLPARFNRLFKIWFLLGWPAFLALLAIFFLMIVKPA